MRINNFFSERTERWQAIVAWAVFFFVNVIFCIKYNTFERIHPVYFIIFYPIIVLGIYKITFFIRIQQKNYFFLILTCLIIALSFILWHYVDRWSVNVDRWSALAYWSENLKNGTFPYGTPTHLGRYESPLPVWQLFHFPFHLLGDTAYGQLFCLIVFFIMLFCCRTKLNIGGLVLLLALSPCFWWEIAVRSDLLCNMLLLFVFLTALFYYSAFWEKNKILTAAIVGLFLCTKLFVAIPLFLYFFPKFLKYPTKEKILFLSTVIICFSAPFLPFLFGEQGFLKNPEYNPFLIQMFQGKEWQILQNIILSFVAGAVIIIASSMWKRINDLFFLTGVFLFALVLIVGISFCIKDGLHSVIFDPVFDKSYFNVCIPFFLFFINEIKKKKFSYSNFLIDY